MLRIVLALNILLVQYPKWVIAGFRARIWPLEASIIAQALAVMDPKAREVIESNLEESDLAERVTFSSTEVVFSKLSFLCYDQTRLKRLEFTGEKVLLTLDIMIGDRKTWVEIRGIDGRLYSLRFGLDTRALRNETRVKVIKAKGHASLNDS